MPLNPSPDRLNQQRELPFKKVNPLMNILGSYALMYAVFKCTVYYHEPTIAEGSILTRCSDTMLQSSHSSSLRNFQGRERQRQPTQFGPCIVGCSRNIRGEELWCPRCLDGPGYSLVTLSATFTSGSKSSKASERACANSKERGCNRTESLTNPSAYGSVLDSCLPHKKTFVSHNSLVR